MADTYFRIYALHLMEIKKGVKVVVLNLLYFPRMGTP